MPNADQIASVILQRQGGLTDPKKLQKLLYYVQSWHTAITSEPLFTERFKAWTDGPVVPQVWHLRKEPVTRAARSQDTSNIALDDMSSDIIDLVLAKYGDMTADELSALTHTEAPWLTARGDLPKDAPSDAPLDLQLMGSFYRQHQFLGGRTAADLAAGGVHLEDAHVPVDMDAIFAELEDIDIDYVDPWGGANLVGPSSSSVSPQ